MSASGAKDCASGNGDWLPAILDQQSFRIIQRRSLRVDFEE